MKPYLKFKKWLVQKTESDPAYLTDEVAELAQNMVDSLLELRQKSPKSIHWKVHSSERLRWVYIYGDGTGGDLGAAYVSIFNKGHEKIYIKALVRLLNQITPCYVWVTGNSWLEFQKVEMQFINNPDKASKKLALLNT